MVCCKVSGSLDTPYVALRGLIDDKLYGVSYTDETGKMGWPSCRVHETLHLDGSEAECTPGPLALSSDGHRAAQSTNALRPRDYTFRVGAKHQKK